MENIYFIDTSIFERRKMLNFRVCILYGKSYPVTINENIVSLENFRKTIKNLLPPFRELDDYFYVVSGKPPHKLNLNNEEEFNQHRTLITTGCYIWMKLIK
jgi:hypothetical protein